MDHFQWNFPHKTVENEVQKAHNILFRVDTMPGVYTAPWEPCRDVPSNPAQQPLVWLNQCSRTTGWQGVATRPRGHGAYQAFLGKGYAKNKVKPKTEDSFSAFLNPQFSLKNKLS